MMLRKERRALACVALLYSVVALLYTYPLVVQIGSHLAGVPGEDAMQHLWISWWTKYALIDLGISPMQVDWLYYPDGVIHPMLWVTPYAPIAGLPLALFVGQIPAYNIHLLLSFVLSGLTTYLLVLYLTRCRTAAVLAGLVFAIFPNRMAQSTAHFAQAITYLFPLCILYLIRLKQQPNIRNTLIFGVLWGLGLLVNIIHIAYLLLPVLVVFIGYWLLSERQGLRSGRTWLHLGLGLSIGGLISAPLLLPFAWYALTGKLDYLSQGGVLDFSADLLAFFVPPATHPILSHWAEFKVFSERLIGAGNFRENTVYLGIVPIVLAVWAMWRSRANRIMPWLALCVGASVLSLGPTLKVGGLVTDIPLPYAIVQYLPFYKWGRIPGRFNETIVLGLAVLAAYGFAALTRNLKACQRLGLTVALSVLIGLEYWTVWPFPTMSGSQPEFYQEWRQDRRAFAVLDLPQWPLWVREASNYAMFYQTAHQHPIVGGYVWRLPQGRAGVMKAFQELLWPDGQTDIISRRRGSEAVPLLNQYNLRYVVIHPHTLPPEDVANDVAAVAAALGEPFYKDSQVIAFVVPTVPPPNPDEPLISFSYNWYMVEPIDGRPARWLHNDGTLYVHWLHKPATSYHLAFKASPFHRPRHLVVLVNGRELGRMVIAEPRLVELAPIDFDEGQNEVLFHVPDGCDVPAETVAGNEDRRCLSVLFQDMELSPITAEAQQ